MKKKEIIITVACLIIIVIAVGIYFGVDHYLKKDLDNAKNDLKETIEKYGTVEKENISTLIAKFNTEIMDSGINYPASEDYLTVENEEYWYGLYEDIYCYIVPEKFTGNKETDIVSIMAIYYPTNTNNKEMAINYIKKLIKINNEDITEEEIDNLLEEAQFISSSKKNAQSKKGIAISYKEIDGYENYQVIRINK